MRYWSSFSTKLATLAVSHNFSGFSPHESLAFCGIPQNWPDAPPAVLDFYGFKHGTKSQTIACEYLLDFSSSPLSLPANLQGVKPGPKPFTMILQTDHSNLLSILTLAPA